MKSQTNQLFMFALVTGLLTLLGFSDPSYAVPANPGVFDVSQPDGAVFKARAVGDEHRNWTETEAGFSIAKAANGYWQYLQNSQSPILTGIPAHHGPPAGVVQHARPVTGPSTAPTVGEIQAALGVAPVGNFSGSVLYILADFTDRAGTYNEASWGTFVSNNVADYYNKASYGKVTLTPAVESFGTANNGVVGWLNMGYAHPNTASNPGVAATQMLVRDAVIAADPYVDYASYDTNANGVVDPEELAIVVIVAGYEAAYGGAAALSPSTWGHKWGTGAYAPVVDGKSVQLYCMFGEIHATSTITPHQATMGVQVHELGHLIFGLPDLYDTDGSSGGIGAWGLMSGGSWGAKTGEYQGATPVLPSAWSKYNRGWVDGVASSGAISLHGAGSTSATSANTVARFSTSNVNEYYLLENRQNTGYDQGLQRYTGGSFGGLAIWHIDENVLTNSNDAHRKVDLEAADGLTGPSGTGGARATDLWYVGNKTTFNSLSSPNSYLYSGLPSGASVYSISASSDIMNATLGMMTAPGCTGQFAINYDPLATEDDGSCIYPPSVTYNISKVEDTNDGVCDADCSLREAVMAVNNGGGGGDTIILPPETFIITLPGNADDAGNVGDFDIHRSVNIVGAGAGATIISGEAMYRVFDIHGTVNVSISDVTIEKGLTSATGGPGAGILNRIGTLTVANSMIRENVTSSSYSGGGIYSTGNLIVNNSTFDGNTGGVNGGGIAGDNQSTVTVTNSTFTNNIASAAEGGGIFINGTLILTNSTFSNNSAKWGGGVAIHTIYNTSTRSSATISGSTFNGNFGIFQSGAIAVYYDCDLILTNSTISGNEGGLSAGGMSVGGIATITNSTITNNTAPKAAGIMSSIFGAVYLSNSIVANQAGGNDCVRSSLGNNYPTITSNGYNLDSDGTCGFTGTGDIQFANPLLGLLANNGGPTMTHAIPAGSPAINSGSCVNATDQRGVARPPAIGCDIGAYENITVAPPQSTAPNDFNNDGMSDLLWRKDSTGANYVWQMNGTTKTGCNPGNAGIAWSVAGTGNFDGLAGTDILWRHNTTGWNQMWFMNGCTKTSLPALGVATTWSAAAIGDFDNDGKSDILWRKNSTGANYVWLMNGTTKTAGCLHSGTSTTSSVVGTGDFDSDGMTDILWHDSATGTNSIWFMNGCTKTTGNPGTSPASMSVAGVGNFDGLAGSDILWRNSTTGVNSVWLMTGAAKTICNPGGANPFWSVAKVGDYDGDGKSDLVWRKNSTGANYVWFMNGCAKVGGSISGVSNIWSMP